jgi:two-component system sensor histidine kinase VicK
MDHDDKVRELALRLEALEQTLNKETHKMNAIFSSMTEGLVGVDASYKIVLLNQAASIMLRMAESDALGKSVVDVMALYKNGVMLPKNSSPIVKALEEHTIVRVYHYDNITLRDSGGSEIPVVLSATSFLGRSDIEGMAGIIMFRNIAPEKAVDRAKTEFVSLAAHQLRTPLTSINWYSEMLLAGDADKLSDKQLPMMQEISGSARRMTKLVDDLLNVSRVDLGTFKVDPVPVNWSELLISVLSELTPEITEKKMHVEKKVGENLPQVNADPTLARMIIQNLLTNAIKYTPEEGTITCTLGVEGSDLALSVADTGYGIPLAEQPKIFTKLYRAENVRDKVTDGTGLGLYVIKAVVEETGGTIRFASQETKGTTFYITIPLSGMKAHAGSKPLS